MHGRPALPHTRREFPSLPIEIPKATPFLTTRQVPDVQQVLGDVMGLTKLNYNSCRHSDGWPVTLKCVTAGR